MNSYLLFSFCLIIILTSYLLTYYLSYSPPIHITPFVSDQPILKYTSPSTDFSVQLLTLSNAILLAKLTNTSLVLPDILRSSSYPHQLQFSKLFDITKLELKLLETFSIRIVNESSLQQIHHYYLHHSALKYTSLSTLLLEFDKYLLLNSIVLDVGDLFERMIPITCQDNQQLSEILHLVIQCFHSHLIMFAMDFQTQILGGTFNSLRIASKNDLLLLRQNHRDDSYGFQSNLPIYLSCSFDCEEILSNSHGISSGSWSGSSSSSSNTFENLNDNFNSLHILTLSHSTLSHYHHSLSTELTPLIHDLLSSSILREAVDLLILRESEIFRGHHNDQFNELLVSERLYLQQISNYCVENTALLPSAASSSSSSSASSSVASLTLFQKCTKKLFGISSPDPTCMNTEVIRDILPTAQRFEELDHLSSLLTSVGIENSAFNHLFYLLLDEHPLPIIYQYLHLSPSADIIEVKNALRQLFKPRSIEYQMICHAFSRIIGIKVTNHPPLRLLIVSHNSQIQGAPLVVYYIAKMFREKLGYEVDFFVPSVGRGKLEDWLTSLGVRILVGQSLSAINSQLYSAIYLNTIVTWYHNSMNSHSYNSIYQKKAIMYVHESLRNELFKIYPLTPEVMQEVHSLIFVTNRSMQVYSDILTSRIHPNNYVIANTIPNGIVLKSQILSVKHKIRQKLNIPSDAILFVISGDVYPNRNQRIFLEAAENILSQELNSQNIKPYFMIIGFSENTPYQLHVRKMASTSIYYNHYFLYDKMLHETALEYMAAADVYVSLALLESFGLALLEAMTMGIPIIVAKLDGVPDVIYKEALDVDPTSVKSVTSAMKQMLDPQIRAEHSRHSHERSKYFDEKFHFVKHLNILRKVAVIGGEGR